VYLRRLREFTHFIAGNWGQSSDICLSIRRSAFAVFTLLCYRSTMNSEYNPNGRKTAVACILTTTKQLSEGFKLNSEGKSSLCMPWRHMGVEV